MKFQEAVEKGFCSGYCIALNCDNDDDLAFPKFTGRSHPHKNF